MKILMLTTHLNCGGITSYVYNLSKGLVKRGHCVFAASSGGNFAPEFDKTGIKHFCFPLKTKSELSPKLWAAFFQLKGIIKKEKIEILHTHTRITHCLGWYLSKSSAVNWLSTAHGYYKVRWGRKIFPAWGEKTIAISPAVKEHLTGDFKLPEKKVKVVFTGIDLEKFRPGLDEQGLVLRRKFGLENILTVGMIGRFSPEKGHRFFLEAAARLKEERIKFVIIGNGKAKFQPELKAFLDDKRIISLDYLESLEALKLIDIFIQPSLQEGLGIAILEAMASGKAVVASRVGGIPSVIDDEINGLLVAPGDSKILSEVIIRLVKDEKLRNFLGKAARKKAEAKFDVKKMAGEIEKVYEEVLKKGL